MKKPTILTVVAIAFATPLAAQQMSTATQNRITAEFLAADDAYSKGKYSDAWRRLEAVRQLNPGAPIPTAQDLRVKVRIAQGNWDAASKELRALERLDLSSTPNIVLSIAGYSSRIGNGLQSQKRQRLAAERASVQRKRAWDLAVSKNTWAGYNDFLKRYPYGQYSNAAKQRVERFKTDADIVGRRRAFAKLSKGGQPIPWRVFHTSGKYKSTYGYVDRNGQFTIKPQFLAADPFEAGYAITEDDRGKVNFGDSKGDFRPYRLIDLRGNTVFGPYAKMERDGRYVFAHHSWSSRQYPKAAIFDVQLGRVISDGQWHQYRLFPKSNRVILTRLFERVKWDSFNNYRMNEFARRTDGLFSTDDLSAVIPANRYLEIGKAAGGYFVVHTAGKRRKNGFIESDEGVLDFNGRTIIPTSKRCSYTFYWDGVKDQLRLYRSGNNGKKCKEPRETMLPVLDRDD